MTIQFLLDCKQWSQEQHRCFSSNAVSLIFTTLYPSAFLIMTLTLFQVKTNFKNPWDLGHWSVTVIYIFKMC